MLQRGILKKKIENMWTYQNLWEAAKTMLSCTFIVFSAYFEKEERLKVNSKLLP